MSKLSIVIAGALALLGAAHGTRGQTPQGSARGDTSRPARRGFFLDGSLGGGAIDFQNANGRALLITESNGNQRVVPIPHSQGGLGLAVALGWGFTDRFEALFDADVVAPWGDGFNQFVGAAAIRYRPVSRLWLEGGWGVSSLRYNIGDKNARSNSFDNGRSFIAAAGLELARGQNWMVDLRARTAAAQYDGLRAQNLSVHLGGTWYKIWGER